MKKQTILRVTAGLLVSLFLVGTALWGQRGRGIQFPEGYRKWTHVKSMVIQSGHPLYASFGGIHHIYANDFAFTALRKDMRFPDGSVLVFDLLEARSEGNAIVEGSRKFVAVMEKDSERFPDTGGWGFQAFKGAGEKRERMVTDAKKECFTCHAGQKKSDFVFSDFRH